MAFALFIHRDASFHILITNYQILVNEEKLLRRVKWQYMVLDEAQAIKSSSRLIFMHVSVFCLNSEFRNTWFPSFSFGLLCDPCLTNSYLLLSTAASAGRLCWALTVEIVCFLLGHQFRTTWLSYGHFSISSCPLCLIAMNSLMSGSQKGNVRLQKLWLLYFLSFSLLLTFLLLASIEGHAEHGGTLNEHQLSRLVSYFYI